MTTAPTYLVEAYPGELNQVWTNLVDNAVDAMDGRGHAHDRHPRRRRDAVVVEVGDTGPGMPAEVAARAFEAFYTTKDVGKGTGLGLDIARRIVVERHGGTIEVDSRPGATTLRVRCRCAPGEGGRAGWLPRVVRFTSRNRVIDSLLLRPMGVPQLGAREDAPVSHPPRAHTLAWLP